MHAFITNNVFVVEPVKSTGWGSWKAPEPVLPEWANDPEKKKAYGIELAKDHASPFIAACAVFEDAGHALWASINWLSDPEVVAARDIYVKTVELDVTLLDKDQFAAKILKIIDVKTPEGKRTIASDDLVKYLELYAKVRGFLKPDNQGSSPTILNEIKVTLVRAEKDQKLPKVTIEQSNDNDTPVTKSNQSAKSKPIVKFVNAR